MKDGSTTLSFAKGGVRLGRAYLAAGGPSSRLEKLLSKAALRCGFEVETFASPTGLFLTVLNAKDAADHCTLVARIEKVGIRFDVLESVERALSQNPPQFNTPLETRTLGFGGHVLAALILGLSLSLVHSGWGWEAPICALLTAIVVGLHQPFEKMQWGNGVFSEFILSLLSFGSAAVLARHFGLGTEGMLIGPLLYLVPGLTLTTAVSELAEQNFVSGTAKLMKGILTLFAMGAALLLLQDLGRFWDVPVTSFARSEKANPDLWILLVFNVTFVWSFSRLFYLPMRAFWGACLTSTLSSLLLLIFMSSNYLILPLFLTSFVVGVVSLSLGALLRMPSQSFSVPGIFSMLPGLLALGSFEKFAAGFDSSGLNFAFRVFLSAAVIVFGLLCARIPFSWRRAQDTELHHGTL